MRATNCVERLSFESQKTFETWLEANHDKAKGVWLMIAKKGTGIASATYGEAVEIALAYGRIDSQISAFDQGYCLQRFTPRGPRSRWSWASRDKAIELIGSGKMKRAGHAPSGAGQGQRRVGKGHKLAATRPLYGRSPL